MAFPGIGDSQIPGDGESPHIKQILEKKFQNWFVINTLKFFGKKVKKNVNWHLKLIKHCEYQHINFQKYSFRIFNV